MFLAKVQKLAELFTLLLKIEFVQLVECYRKISAPGPSLMLFYYKKSIIHDIEIVQRSLLDGEMTVSFRVILKKE